MKRLFLALSIAISLLFLGCELTPPDTVKVIYYSNGSTSGFPPTDDTQYTSGMEATVLDQGTLKKPGMRFKAGIPIHRAREPLTQAAIK